MYVCMYVRMYVCTYLCMYVCNVHMYIRIITLYFIITCVYNIIVHFLYTYNIIYIFFKYLIVDNSTIEKVNT